MQGEYSVPWAELAWAAGRCLSEARSLQPALPSASTSEVTVYNQNWGKTWLSLDSLSPKCRPIENPGKIMGEGGRELDRVYWVFLSSAE